MRKGNVHIIDILGIVQERVVCYNSDDTFLIEIEYHSDKIRLSLFKLTRGVCLDRDNFFVI
jgi:hypothetical protein